MPLLVPSHATQLPVLEKISLAGKKCHEAFAKVSILTKNVVMGKSGRTSRLV
jgi:hypothetical protein